MTHHGLVEEEHDEGHADRDRDAAWRVQHEDATGLYDDVAGESAAQGADHAQRHAAHDVELALARGERPAHGTDEHAQHLKRKGQLK